MKIDYRSDEGDFDYIAVRADVVTLSTFTGESSESVRCSSPKLTSLSPIFIPTFTSCYTMPFSSSLSTPPTQNPIV
jgi:hypothetical protein